MPINADLDLIRFRGERISIPMFAPPGVTVMDGGEHTAIIQAAFDYCAPKGLPLYLPGSAPVQYTSLTLPAGLILYGEGGSTLLHKPGSAVSGTPAIKNANQSTGDSNISIRGITFDFNSSNQPGKTSVRGIELKKVSNLKISNCRFLNCIQDPLWGTFLDDIDIIDSYFDMWIHGNAGAAINFGANYGGNISNIRISRCTFKSFVCQSTCINLSCQDNTQSAKRMIVTENFIELGNAGIFTLTGGVYGSFQTGVAPAGDATLAIQIFCNGVGGASEIAIANNVIMGQQNLPPDINGLSPNICYGISVASIGGKTPTVTGNVIRDCLGPGIETSDGMVCSGNTMDNTSGISIVAGFRADVLNLQVTNNVILNTPVAWSYPSTGATAISLAAQNQDSAPVGYSVINILIANNVMSFTTPNCHGVVIDNHTSGVIRDVTVIGNQMTGPGTTDGIGIVITNEDPGGTVEFITVTANSISGFSSGIFLGSTVTNSRLFMNRFKNVHSFYDSNAGGFDPTCTIIDLQGNGSQGTTGFGLNPTDLSIPSLRINNQPYSVLLANGDIQLSGEGTALIVGFPDQAGSPSVAYWNAIAFDEIQGTFISVNSRALDNLHWANPSPTPVYSRAMWVGLGAKQFRIDFGPSTNANGAEPGDIFAFAVRDGEWTYSAYPVGINTFPGAGLHLDVAGNARIQGSLSVAGAMIYTTGYGSQPSSPNYLELGAGGSFPDGISMAFGDGSGWKLNFIADVSGSAHIFATLTDTGQFATGWIGAGVSTPSASTTSLDALEAQVSKVGVGGAPDHAGSTLLKVYGDAEITGVLKNDSLTASRPVITDASKNLVSVKIDLSSANLVQGSGLASGQALTWNGTSVSGVSGLASGTVSDIPGGSPPPLSVVTSVSLTGTVPPGLGISYTTDTASTSFSVTPHPIVDGITQ